MSEFTFSRFNAGDSVLYNGNLGIVIEETHAPYIDNDTVILGKYHVHLACGIECICGEFLVAITVNEAIKMSKGEKK